MLSIPAPEPADLTNHLTAAFARLTDARYAIGILESCGMAPVNVSIGTVNDERGGVAVVILRIEVDADGRARVLAAISGGHGVPVPDPNLVVTTSDWLS